MYVRHDLCLRYLNPISVFIFNKKNLTFSKNNSVSIFFSKFNLNIIYAFYFHIHNNVTNLVNV